MFELYSRLLCNTGPLRCRTQKQSVKIVFKSEALDVYYCRSSLSKSIDAVSSLIQTTFEKCLAIRKSDEYLDNQEIDAVVKNNHEFNACFNDWPKC